MITRAHGTTLLRNRPRGAGLIEVLVAVLVLSIGFLGIAALQVHALSTNNSAMARSMATVASYSILDAMRTDLGSADAGAYNTTVYANACPATTKTLASEQLNQWCQQLGRALGQSKSTQGTVACTNTGDCMVTIQFDDSRAGVGGSATQQVVTRTVL